MTGLWLLMVLICTEPYPAECMSPNPEHFMSRPMCVAVAKSCTLHEAWVQGDRKACVARAAELVAAERRQGYAWASRPECLPREEVP